MIGISTSDAVVPSFVIGAQFVEERSRSMAEFLRCGDEVIIWYDILLSEIDACIIFQSMVDTRNGEEFRDRQCINSEFIHECCSDANAMPNAEEARIFHLLYTLLICVANYL